MRNHLDKDIRKYKRTTKRLLVCPKDYRQQFLNDMERDLRQFMEENPSAGYSDIVAYFGTPEELAQTYLDNIPQEELIKYRYKRRYQITLSLAIVIALSIIVSLYLFYEFNDHEVIYVEEHIEILDEDIH